MTRDPKSNRGDVEDGQGGYPCPFCGDHALEHHTPRLRLLGDHAYACRSCGWEGFGPAPAEIGDDPQLGLADRLSHLLFGWVQ